MSTNGSNPAALVQKLWSYCLFEGGAGETVRRRLLAQAYSELARRSEEGGRTSPPKSPLLGGS